MKGLMRLLTTSALLSGIVFSAACHKQVALAPPLQAAPAFASSPLRPLPPTITLAADKTTIAPGDAVTLQWQSTRATAVLIDSVGSVDLNGTRVIRPQASTSYTAMAR